MIGGAEEQVVGAPDEDEDFEELPPAQLPHHTFGSVWDSQLGVPTASIPTTIETPSGAALGEEEDYEEPEVPEYLLAERRQRGQHQARGRSPRGRSAYQAALDRERYGRGAPQPSFGGGRGPERGSERGRDRGRGRQQQGGRQQSPQRGRERAMATEQRGSSEPWSEVPPELEELLRAELSRKEPVADIAAEEAPVEKPVPRRRSTKAASAEAVESGVAESQGSTTGEPAEAAPAKPTTRSRTTKTVAKPATKARATKSSATAEQGAQPKKPSTRRRTTAPRSRASKASTPEESPAATESQAEED